MRRSFSSPDETLRKELKIRRAAGYFWRTSSCFMLDRVLIYYMKHWEESWKYHAQRSIFDELRVVSCLIYYMKHWEDSWKCKAQRGIFERGSVFWDFTGNILVFCIVGRLQEVVALYLCIWLIIYSYIFKRECSWFRPVYFEKAPRRIYFLDVVWTRPKNR